MKQSPRKGVGWWLNTRTHWNGGECSSSPFSPDSKNSCPNTCPGRVGCYTRSKSLTPANTEDLLAVEIEHPERREGGSEGLGRSTSGRAGPTDRSEGSVSSGGIV